MSNQKRNKKLVVIIPGHGGVDQGAAVNGTTEAGINLKVSRFLADCLNLYDCDVLLLRSHDMTMTLNERSEICNTLSPDLILSLHCNSFSTPGPNGMEVFTSPGQTMSDVAAGRIIDRMTAQFPLSRFRTDEADGDKDKESNYHILRETTSPAVLIEMGFLSNPEDYEKLIDTQYQIKMAQAITAGTVDFLEGT